MPATGVSGVDLYAKDKRRTLAVRRQRTAGGRHNTASFTPPAGEQYSALSAALQRRRVGGDRHPSREDHLGPRPRRRKRASPSSSTAPPSPRGAAPRGRAWPSRPSSAGGWTPVINLGFSGSGKMEPAMADLLAELDPSVYVLDCLWNMSPEMVPRVEPFVEAAARPHPDTPIVLAEDCSVRNVSPRKKGPSSCGRSMQKLTAEGVKNLHFLPSRGHAGRRWRRHGRRLPSQRPGDDAAGRRLRQSTPSHPARNVGGAHK